MTVLLKLFCLFIGGISLALAGDQSNITAENWLSNINQAMRTRSYQGTVIFMKNGQLDTMKYQHSVENGIEQERLTSLNSPLREIIRNSSETSCIFKESSQKLVHHHPMDRSLLIDLPSQFNEANSQYLIAETGQESIASRNTRVLAVLPKDEFRYARKIWVDSQTFLPLKAELYSSEGKTLEQVVFTELTIDALSEAGQSSIDEHQLHVKHIHNKQSEPFESAPFSIKNWPKGFEIVFFIPKSQLQSDKVVDHLLMSDGFSSVSVYVEAKDQQAFQGSRNLGAVNSFSQVIGDKQVTVLGEVPAKTVEYIGLGLEMGLR